MHTFRSGDTTWFLDDPSLEPVVEPLVNESKDRRAHFICPHGSGKVFIKFFYERGLPGLVRNRVLPRGRKEYELSKRLRMLGVLTPKALGYGITTGGSYALYEWVEGEPLIAWIDDPKKRQQLLSSLARLLEELKGKGVRHNDLHLANIVASSGSLYLIDLHSVVLKRRLTQADEVSNAAHALAMLYDDMEEVEKEWFFGLYGCRAQRTAVEEELGRFKKRWVAKKAARAFRSTSLLEALDGRVRVRGAEGEAGGPLVAAIKTDRKVTVERYADHVRKTYTHARRLKRAWRNHVVLEYMRLHITPRAYYVQQASSSRPGYVAMEDLTGKGEELDRFYDRNYDAMGAAAQRGFADALASFLVSSLKKGILHRDLKACNIFVLKSGAFLFLDVEDLEFSGFDEASLTAMFVQLNTSVPRRISMYDRYRLFSKVARRFTEDRKRLLKAVASESLSREIVYEGVGGLKRESWG